VLASQSASQPASQPVSQPASQQQFSSIGNVFSHCAGCGTHGTQEWVNVHISTELTVETRQKRIFENKIQLKEKFLYIE